MNSSVRAVPPGPTQTPTSVRCVLATKRARTSVPPIAMRDTTATLGLSGECPQERACASSSSILALHAKGPDVACHSRARGYLGGLLMGCSPHTHHPRRGGGMALGCLTSALLGSSLWPGAKVNLRGPQWPHPQSQMDRARGTLSPIYSSNLWGRIIFHSHHSLPHARSSCFPFHFSL